MCDEIPEYLEHTTGLIEEINTFIFESATKQSRVVSLSSALAIGSLLTGRKWKTPTNASTILHLLCAVPTGGGKQHALDEIPDLLKYTARVPENGTAMLERLLGSSEVMSQTALVRQVKEQPLSLSLIDEFGQYLKRINAPRSSMHDQNIKKAMLTLWGIPTGKMYKTPQWAGEKSTVVKSPHFVQLGMTNETVWQAFNEDDVENGLLSRLTIFYTAKRAEKRIVPPACLEPSEDLKQHIYDVFWLHEDIEDVRVNMEFGIDRINAPDIEISIFPTTWPDDVEADYKKYEKNLLAFAEKQGAGDFFIRTSEHAVRIATIIALGNFATEISMEDWIYARDLSFWCAWTAFNKSRDSLAANDHQRDQNLIRRTLKKHDGVMTDEALVRYLRGRVRAKDLRSHMLQLIEEGFCTKALMNDPRTGETDVLTYVMGRHR